MLTKLIKNSIFSFIFIFLLFFGINRVKAQVIEYTIPNTKLSFSYDLDTDRYPYYIGTIHTQTYNNTIYLSLYYFDSPYIVSNASQSSYCMPLDSNYPQTPCYLSAVKQSNTNAYWVYYKYSTIDGHLIETNNNNPTFQYTYDNVLLSYYNYSDYIENISSFEYINDIYPNFSTPVGWFLTDSITSPQTHYTLTPDYINLSVDNGLDYEDLNSSGSIEEVEFTHNNITFNHLLKIKISDLYRSDNMGYYKPYFLTYMSSISTGVESNFYITYDKTTNGKPNFPLSILFKENLGAIEKIANGSEEDPFSFDYYGNRKPDCLIDSSIPLFHTTYNDSPNFYNYLLIYPTWYCGYYGETWEPTIWGNDYIYIYYNARLYNNLDTLKEDFKNNPSNFEETNFFNYMVRSLDHFMGRITSIFKLITIFFNSLPYEIRLMFIAVFTLIITLLIYKVIG